MAEYYVVPLKETQGLLENVFMFAGFFHANLPVTWSKVKFTEIFGSC